MRVLIDLKPEAPAVGLALDEVLLEDARDGRGGTVRFWVNDRAVVIGRSQTLVDEVDTVAAARERVPVIRRISGGGAVVHYPGNLNISVVVGDGRRLGSVEQAFRGIGSALVRGLEAICVSASARGSGLYVADAKIGGAAQARRGSAALYHTTILVRRCPIPLERLLLALRPGYRPRGVPSQPHRITSLEDVIGRPTTLAEVVGVIRDELAAALAESGTVESQLDPAERRRAHSLAESKYERWAWTASR